MTTIPFDDPSVDELPDAARQAICRHWTRRATSELRVSQSFARLAPWMRAIGADPVVVSLMEEASLQEAQHSEICRRLAEVYGGRRVDAPDVNITLPSFGRADERMEALLHVAGLCCINETLATAWIGECLSCARAPIAVAANQVHLADEIDHARLGWAHLASQAVTPAMREELSDCLSRLLDANVPLWLRPDAFLPAEGVPEHGHPSAAATSRVIESAVRELVLPGFKHVGVAVIDW